ncbi:diacylglycerol kinase catalytic region [Pseudopedobacter saltans DSM 12145]|uniref:Diacylglycerol kinase catalytic region n=1 Tax=Pseudopedobacter saltans (strain ATCC 51119 / DSM 12145 / JCM 21818 / CCUG 39354 / LMG 10337 / NBRC 100064 / NCIMB 13643) TaxID=762903 RepID=F0S921_PSESL|nr:diacylglycerol kinase family protein [Pseudopedobacter saltans]ADY53508.1 diacylglycerol kinase catalytic region [Pseudopedobacter saltans DSM 12145]
MILRRERILFIVNPISGGKDKIRFPELVDKYLDRNIFEANIVFSEYGGHASILAKEGIDQEYDCVVAVGGDGTINEVASILVFSGKKMGVIPCGSGNGLARTLGIPLERGKAVRRLNRNKVRVIDSGTLNNRRFFNIAGLGFDARISALFADNKGRGLKGYVVSVLKEIKNYKPNLYTIEVDGKSLKREAFMVSIANSSQYGNNAHISPTATIDDGLLDVCIIKPFPLYWLPILITRMLLKNVDSSKYLEIIKGKQIKIEQLGDDPIHIDGEPLVGTKTIEIEVEHLSLNILV